jgi:hypothetical protein
MNLSLIRYTYTSSIVIGLVFNCKWLWSDTSFNSFISRLDLENIFLRELKSLSCEKVDFDGVTTAKLLKLISSLLILLLCATGVKLIWLLERLPKVSTDSREGNALRPLRDFSSVRWIADYGCANKGNPCLWVMLISEIGRSRCCSKTVLVTILHGCYSW